MPQRCLHQRASRVAVLLLTLLSLIGTGGRLMAHAMPNSAVWLDFQPDSVEAELVLPLNELELAFKQPLMADQSGLIARHGAALREYVLGHIQFVAPDGRPWTAEVLEGGKTMRVDAGDPKAEVQIPDLVVWVRLTPPAGAPLRKFLLNYSIICHEVMNHSAFINVRSDWDRAVFAGQPEPVGMIQFTITSLAVDRSGGHWWQGFRTIFRSGMKHIAEGVDHWLFLLVLLLPAPLLRREKRWEAATTWKRCLLQVLKVVTAFTLGHSVTLACATVGWVRLPSQPVEVVIALSILISAIHALRPIFAGREALIAAAFGLIHGLAFAELLTGYGFARGYLASSLAAFNLGIEAQQLLIVAAALPMLLLLSRTKFYAPFRIVSATAAGCVAVWWAWERVAGV